MKKRNHKRKSIVSRVAKRLYDRWGKRLVSGKRGEKIRERLVRIYPGEPVAERVEMYYVEMFALLLKIAGIGITLAVVISVPLWVEGTRELDTVGRNDGGEGDRHVDLLLRRENGQVAEKRIEVAERLYTEEELQQMFTDMLPALEKQMLGQNKSPFCVTVSLKLPDAVEGYPFEMKWHSSRPDVLNRNGSIQEPLTMEEIPVEIKGDFSFQGFEQEKVWKVIVRQAHRTEEDAWEDALETALQESDFDSAYQEEMQLPDRVAGETVVWQEKREHPAAGVLLVTFFGMVLSVWAGGNELDRQGKLREVGLEEEYSGIVTRLALYLGAGMTVKGAWQKTAGFSEADGEYHFAREEMRLTCRELDSGMYETVCYEEFGRRCGRQEYIRLGTLLSQNLKKGNSELLRRLRAEVWQAQENQKHMAKRKGEEAATKLLAPMLMLLGMVLIIIMIPAFGNL